jgi:hypothetical protein
MVKKQEPEPSVKLPIEWHVPKELISRYANNIVVQHTPQEFIVSFFETQPPLVVGNTEEQAKQLKTIKSVQSLCVSRIIISPDRMGDFINALQTNYQNYLSKRLMKK